MMAWTREELAKIGDAGELQLASRRPDGTLRRPVTIWVVRDGDELYVRSGYGRDAAWFRATELRREGHISAGGVERDVAFAEADEALNDGIDAAYRSKYRGHGANYVDMMVAPAARSTTIRLVPR